MPILTSVDCLVLWIYLLFVLGIGFSFKSAIKSGGDFLAAGRSLPVWVCGLALAGAGLGAPEVMGLGAAGARFGLYNMGFFLLGMIPAIVAAGLFLTPRIHGSKARSVAEYLRFDRKTRALSAASFTLMMVLSSGVALAVMARVVEALHLFDGLFREQGWDLNGIFTATILLASITVLVSVLWGGLAGALYSRVLMFFVLMAGLLPMVERGLHRVGGWSGLTSALGSRPFEDWSGLAQSGSHSWNTALVGLGAGIVLGVCFWCVDFRALQPALAAQSRESAGRTPLVAAIPWLLVALLAVGSGALAIALPTPHTSVVQQEVEGTIVRTTTVVRPEEEAGHGLVSAQVDGGGTRRNAAGQPLLDYNMATPRLMRQTLANGLLGLGITLLLTCLMSGLSANLTAFNTVVATDLYEPFFTKAATDKSSLAAARFVAGGGMMLFVAAACVVNRSHCSDLLLLLPRALVVVNAPLLAVLFLGLRRKRAQGAGAGRVAALVGGMVTAVLHLGLTLPAGEAKGSIVPLFHYPSEAAQLVATALLAMVCSGLVVGVNGLLRATPLDEKS